MPIDEEWLKEQTGKAWDLRQPPTCPNCGYNMTGLEEPRCPECGHRYTWDEIRRRMADQEVHKAERVVSVVHYAIPYSLLAVGLVLCVVTRVWPQLAEYTRPVALLLGALTMVASVYVLRDSADRKACPFVPGPRLAAWPLVVSLIAGSLLTVFATSPSW